MACQTETTGGMDTAARKREGALHMRLQSTLSDPTAPAMGILSHPQHQKHN
jgi:hypothetical protein